MSAYATHGGHKKPQDENIKACFITQGGHKLETDVRIRYTSIYRQYGESEAHRSP